MQWRVGGTKTPATNVRGRNGATTQVSDAATKQSSRGYDAQYYYQPDRSTIKSRLPSDGIFFFDGHGQAGGIQTKESPDERFFAKNSADGYDFDSASTSYGNMKLAVFMGCNTGNPDKDVGNLVDVVNAKSAGCAYGWTDSIVTEGAYNWSPAFWSSIKNGKSIDQSHQDGLTAVKEDPTCKSLDPASIWQYCKFEKVYSQGGMCKHPLPKGDDTNQIEQKSESDKWMIYNNPSDNFPELEISREKQIIQNFANDTNLTLIYEKSLHYEYGDLNAFSCGAALYLVNSKTEKVQSVIFNNSNSGGKNKVVSSEEGFKIAETFAKEKNPEFWNTTDGRKVIYIDHGESNNRLVYFWNQMYTSYNNVTQNATLISSYNMIDVGVNPYTGDIDSYHEWYLPFDPTLNLVPALTEDQAWEKARLFFETLGMKGIQNDQRQSFGLKITPDSENVQHLIWQFEVLQKDTKNNDLGGQVGIDSDDGQVVWMALIGETGE